MGRIKTKVGDIYRSNNYGDVEVLEVIGKRSFVRFLNTGFETDCDNSCLKNGYVKDASVAKPLNKYIVGDIYQSSKWGDFEIIEIFKDKAKVRFVNTGYETECFKTNISCGTVCDRSIPNCLGKHKIGDILHSEKYGDAKIIDIIKKERNPSTHNTKLRTLTKVQFLDTGYVTTCDPTNFIVDKVRDYLKPNVQGVGILGYIEHLDGRLRDMKEYRLWESILGRCYGIADYSKKNTSYEFAEIEDRWKRFDYFLSDLIHINGYDMWKKFHDEHPNTKNIFEFDKDTIVSGNKTYSRSTCRFIPKFINAGYTLWADETTKIELLNELEELDYESIIIEAKSRGLL